MCVWCLLCFLWLLNQNARTGFDGVLPGLLQTEPGAFR